MAGPLSGVKAVELAGLGPAPFCGMLLADLGADVVRVDRTSEAVGEHTPQTRFDLHNRGKRSVAVDLKQKEGPEVVLDLVAGSDVLIEGFRPGVAERLGIGPAECLARNRALVYGRVTGWGQQGPYSGMAGHDIDYIAVSGALHAIGTEAHPVPPLNLVGDFGGGGMLLAVGVLAGLLHAARSGEGQVVDAAMVDGSALLMTMTHGYASAGVWANEREANLLDGGAPFYSVYETSDGRHVAVGALEPQFFGELLDGLGIDRSDVGPQGDREGWPAMRQRFADRFRERTRDEWADHFTGRDACVAPILSMTEAPGDRHNRMRATFLSVADVTQPAPAPRFSETVPAHPGEPSFPGRDTDEVLYSLGYSDERISMLRRVGAVA